MQNLASLKAFKTPSDFVNGFTVTDENWKQFITTAAKDSVNIGIISAKEKSGLSGQIKSAIARLIWRTEGFYEVMNTNDEAIKKAVEVIGAGK